MKAGMVKDVLAGIERDRRRLAIQRKSSEELKEELCQK